MWNNNQCEVTKQKTTNQQPQTKQLKLQKRWKKKWAFHNEKLHSLKPCYLTTKTQKTIPIQLLCNYFLGITISVQLSF
jgi:hypothetical protein